MADVVDRETRSRMMSGIRGKDTKPEMIVRRYLHRHGFRFRLHDKRLPGHPDIVLPKYHTVVFVHGCFWHGHKRCRFAFVPKTRRQFWIEKIAANRERDYRNEGLLHASGWRVGIVWECRIREASKTGTIDGLGLEICKFIRNDHADSKLRNDARLSHKEFGEQSAKRRPKSKQD